MFTHGYSTVIVLVGKRKFVRCWRVALSRYILFLRHQKRLDLAIIGVISPNMSTYVMDNDTPPLTLIQKLCAIQQALKVPKSHYNEFGHYPFRTAEDIYNAVKPLTQQFDCALTLTDEPVLYGNRIYIKATSRLLDDSGSLSTDGYAREADAQKGMNEAQLTGASSSFARKYALCGLLLLDDSKDIDTFDHRGTAPQSTTRAPGAAPTNAINQIIQMIKNQDVDGIKCHWHTLINDHWAQLDESARLELNALVRSQ